MSSVVSASVITTQPLSRDLTRHIEKGQFEKIARNVLRSNAQGKPDRSHCDTALPCHARISESLQPVSLLFDSSASLFSVVLYATITTQTVSAARKGAPGQTRKNCAEIFYCIMSLEDIEGGKIFCAWHGGPQRAGVRGIGPIDGVDFGPSRGIVWLRRIVGYLMGIESTFEFSREY